MKRHIRGKRASAVPWNMGPSMRRSEQNHSEKPPPTTIRGFIVTNSVFRGCRNGAMIALVLLGLTPSVCTGNSLELIKKIPHTGYSEGLDFHNGFLWNALPQQIVKIDPKDGSVVQRFTPASQYSESIKWASGSFWNLSFSDNGLYRGKLNAGGFSFEKITTVPESHGWGIEKVGSELVVTGNFSNKLYFFDPSIQKWTRTLETNETDLEDLAWDGKRLWTSSYTRHAGKIFSIDLKTGKSEGYWELPNADQCPVVDGIAFDGKSLWITGKECPSIYQVKLPTQRILSSKPNSK